MLLACNPWSTFERGICLADAVLGLVAWGLHLCFPWRLGKQRGIQCQHCAGRISYDRKLGTRQFWRLIIKESHQTKPSILVNITINPITDGNPFKLTLWYHTEEAREKNIKRWDVRWIKPYIHQTWLVDYHDYPIWIHWTISFDHFPINPSIEPGDFPAHPAGRQREFCQCSHWDSLGSVILTWQTWKLLHQCTLW